MTRALLGYCVVNDESHVGLVDPHAEGHGRHDYLYNKIMAQFQVVFRIIKSSNIFLL
jgi:hypothetical protein